MIKDTQSVDLWNLHTMCTQRVFIAVKVEKDGVWWPCLYLCLSRWGTMSSISGILLMRQIAKQLMKGLKGRNEAAAMCVPGAFPRPVQVYVLLLEEGPFFPAGHSCN